MCLDAGDKAPTFLQHGQKSAYIQGSSTASSYKNGNSATKPTLRIQADNSLSDMKAQEDEIFFYYVKIIHYFFNILP